MIISFIKKITLGPNGTILTVQAIAPQGQTEAVESARELGTFDGITYLYIPENVGYTLSAGVEYNKITDLDAFIEQFPEFSDLNTEEEQNAATEALREKLIADVEAAGHRFDQELEVKDMYFVSSLGFPCDGDRKSTQNITGLVAGFDKVAAMLGIGNVVAFRDRDNQDHLLTKDQISILESEIGVNGSFLYAQKWQQLKFLATASKEELKNFKVTFVMSDFSQDQPS